MLNVDGIHLVPTALIPRSMSMKCKESLTSYPNWKKAWREMLNARDASICGASNFRKKTDKRLLRLLNEISRESPKTHMILAVVTTRKGALAHR